jgi:hypothetical protein
MAAIGHATPASKLAVPANFISNPVIFEPFSLFATGA